MRRRYLIQGQPYDVVVTRGANGALCVRRAERQYLVHAEPMADGRLSLNVDGRTQSVWVAARGDSRFVHNPATGAVEVETVHVTAASGGGSGGAASNVLQAPMPGTVLAVHVAEGEVVQAGQALMVIESMKLETTLMAPHAARVQKVHYAVGNTFALKSTLVTLQDLEELTDETP